MMNNFNKLKMKMKFSFKQISITSLILIIMISNAKQHDEIEELETNFLSHKDKDVDKSDKKGNLF